jgi:predicted  nucleic acid-binding Zn-ribbon protein
MPVLRDSCLNCHNPDKKKAGLDLSTYQGTMSGSDNGVVVKPGDPAGSLLMKTITHAEEPFMPQKADKLPDAKITLFKTWIATGAPETNGSKVTVVEKKNDLATVVATIGKPSGPPPMPAVRLALDPVVFTQRPGALGALACSPWAPLAALAGQHQIVLYNTQTLDVLGVLPFSAGQPDVVRFSKNGSLLLAAGGQAAKSGKVIIWNVQTGQKVAEVGDEFDTVLAADLSPDQASVTLGTPNKTLKNYNTKDGKVAWTVKKHTDWVTAVAYSPDGVLVASGDRAGNLYVWEAKTGRDFYTLGGHKDAITDVAFRDDGNVLVSASADGTIRLWNMHDGANLKTQNAHGNGVTSIAFAHDGRIATCGRDNTAKVWTSEAEGPKAFEAFSDVALHVAFTDDGQRVIAGDWTGAVRVFNVADAKKLGDLTANPAGPAQRLAGAQKVVADLQTESDRLTAEANNAKAAADKSNTEYATARSGKGADQVDAALNQVNQASNNAKQANDAFQNAKNQVAQKQGELNNLNQQKIQTTIVLENAVKGQRQGARQRMTQIEQQIKQTEEALAVATKAVKPAQENADKLAAAAKTANEALAKALNDADPAAKQLPAKGDAMRAANGTALNAKTAADAASAKLAAAKADVDRLKASIAGNPPATQPSAKGS